MLFRSRGQGWFIDDIDPLPHAGHAAIVRSPFAHARILFVDTSAALAVEGVLGVVTGAEIAALTRPFPSVLDVDIDYRPAAHDVARFAGEPVAVVVARDRYIAEDAAALAAMRDALALADAANRWEELARDTLTLAAGRPAAA